MASEVTPITYVSISLSQLFITCCSVKRLYLSNLGSVAGHLGCFQFFTVGDIQPKPLCMLFLDVELLSQRLWAFSFYEKFASTYISTSNLREGLFSHIPAEHGIISL